MMRAFLASLSFFFLASIAAAEPPVAVGQWIWSRSDLASFRTQRSLSPGLEAGIFVATVAAERGKPVLRRALSPALVDGPRAVVVRFDGSFHAFWKEDDLTVAEASDRLLAGLLQGIAATGAEPREVQLDYDCPERFLRRWAALVRFLASGVLKDREVWITSLPVHLRHEDFGGLFRGSVAGHIPQVFDTGLRYAPETAAALRERLDRAALPFRLGLGAFERASEDRTKTTDHGRWRESVPLMERSAFYRGLWIFSAGQPWNLSASKGL